MRFLDKTHIYPKPSSATRTAAQGIFRRVLIYISVVNRFRGEQRPRNNTPASDSIETQDGEEVTPEVPDEVFREPFPPLEETREVLANSEPNEQVIIFLLA